MVTTFKKNRNRARYSSFFSKLQSQKLNHPKHSILKFIGYILSCLLFGLIYLLFYNFKSNINYISKQNSKITFAVVEEPALSSFIPGFRVAARRQILQQVYLRKMEMIAFNSSEIENDYRQEAKVTDKVLVVPKHFG